MTFYTRTPDLSRRSLFWAAAAGFPVLLAGASAAAAKISKSSVAYQDSPHGSAKCATCKMFTAPSSCKLVEGNVSANGWCGMWVKA